MNNDKQVIIEQYRLLLQAYLDGDGAASFPVEELAQQANLAGLVVSDVTTIFKEVLVSASLAGEDQPRFAKIIDFLTQSVNTLTALQTADRSQVEAQLRASEEKFRVIFQESLDVIVIIDGQTGLILDVNQTTQHVLGYEENQLLGQHFSMLMPDFEASTQQDFLGTLEIYGPVFEGQEFLKSDGSICPVDLMATVILWSDKKAVMLSLRDVTQRKQVELEINQRNRELLTLEYIGTVMASGVDLGYLLDIIAREIVNLMGVEACLFSEWDQEVGTLTHLASYGLPDWQKRRKPSEVLNLADYPENLLVLEQGLIRQITASQPGIDSAEFVYLKQHNIKTLLMLPLRFQSQILGLVALEDTTLEKTFSEDTLRLAQLLASQAAAALHISRLHSEMERYNQQFLILHELDRAISNSLDLNDVYASLAQVVSPLLPHDRMSFTLRRGDTLEAVYRYPENVTSFLEGVEAPLETSFVGWVIQNDVPGLRRNLAEERKFAEDAAMLAIGLHSAVVVPLWVQDQVIGTWNLASYQIAAYDQHDVNIALVIADQLAVAIRHAQLYQQAQLEIAERKQTEEMLRSSQELFQQVVSSISDHIYVTEVIASGKLNNIYMSPNASDFTGYPVETLLNSWSFWPSVLIHPEDRSIAEEQAQRLIAGQSSDVEYRLIRADGQTIWVRDSGRVHAEGDKKIIYGVVGDITERKQRERELEAIATIATALRSALTHTEMISLMLDPILKLLQIDGATLDIYDPTTKEMVVELARGEWANLIGLRTPADKGVAGHVLTTGQAYVINEAQSDPLIQDPKTLGPLKAIACVPLLAQNQIVGVLWVGRRDEMTADTVRPLSAITDIAANALYRAELFEQLQRSNSKLVRLTRGLEGLVKQRTSDLEQAVMEVSEARDRIDAIVYSIADGLVVTDLENKVILANPAAEKLLGFKLDEILGREIGTGIKDDDLRQIVRGTLNQYINGYEIDIEIEDEGDDKPKIVRAYTSLVDDRQGQPLGTVTIIQDVTAIREVDRMKTEFLTTAAHEFRTPLTSVQGFSEILLTRDLDKERQKRYLTMINTQATHLANIVRDLLDVARLEAGRGLEIKPEPTDLGQLIGETLLPFRETLSNHILVEPNLGEMPLVMADRFRLAQVLENLISNAIKYSPEGGTVTISARTVRYRVELSIQDNGIGMTQEQQKHLFEKFYRADTSNTTISGTGLGLALCKLIVELHRGRIWIESEPGHGATVYFTLPIAESKRDNVSPPS